MKQALAGLRMLLVLTVITGILYPFGVWAVSRLPGLRDNAEGSLVTVNGQVVGSELIGIDPVAADPNHDPWFHTRPSAMTDPSTSGGSNKGAFAPDLVAAVQERRDAIAKREGVDPARIPADAVTASASGVDPQISPAYAELQAPRGPGERPDRAASPRVDPGGHHRPRARRPRRARCERAHAQPRRAIRRPRSTLST